VDSNQYYDKAFTSFVNKGFWASQRVIGLLMVIIVELLLGQERWVVGAALAIPGQR